MSIKVTWSSELKSSKKKEKHSFFKIPMGRTFVICYSYRNQRQPEVYKWNMSHEWAKVLHVLWFVPTICVSVHFCLLRVHFLQAWWGCRARKTATAHLFTQPSIPPNFRMLASALSLCLFFFLMSSHFQTKHFKSNILLQQQSWKPHYFSVNCRLLLIRNTLDLLPVH